MADNTKTITVTTSATEIVPLEPKRILLLVYNNGSSTVFLGFSSTDCTTATSMPLLTKTYIKFKGHADPIWGIVSSGTCDVRVWEDVHP